jgi:GT2 family glycosyltransferase
MTRVGVAVTVTVSILNHNSAQSTIACVKSLLIAGKAVGNDYRLEVFIADNASGCDEQHQLRQFLDEFPNVHFQINDENLGFSAGHNGNLQAIFTQSSPDYIWLLNNDCLVDQDALRALSECAQQKPEVGLWGATLLEPNGVTIQCAGGCFYNSWISSYRQYGHGKALIEIDQLKPVKYDYIAGASLFFPVATLQNGLRPLPMSSIAGNTDHKQWLNESFFLYFEELDLTKRLQSDYSMGWCRNALITHTGGVSTGAVDKKRTVIAEYHSTLSALKFTRLYYPRRLWVMVPARYIFKCFLLLVNGGGHLIKPLTQAYWDFWKNC